MVDAEVIGQEREITGEDLVLCDFCGQPVPGSSLIRVAGVPEMSEPVEALNACEDCRLRIEQEELSFDEEIAAGLQAAVD